MATIYLIRHGQASFGSEDYDRLSSLGSRQAEVLGEYLRECGILLDAAYCGDLLRQRETARLALVNQPGEVPLHIDSRFNEIQNDEQIKYLVPRLVETHPGIRDLMQRGLSSSKDYQKLIDAVFNHWVSPECDEPRLQSWTDYSDGVRNALREVMVAQGGGRTVAIFTSGGTIATIVAQVLGLSGKDTYKFYEPLFNCSISQLFYSGGRISLSYFNDRSFLQVRGAIDGDDLVSYR